MNSDSLSRSKCPDCADPVSRRDFVKVAGAAAVAAGGLTWANRSAAAAPNMDAPAEKTVARFYDSLSPTQRAEICLPFDDPKRTRISANWHVTDHNLGDDFFTDDQRQMVKEIVKGVTSPEGFERFVRQMDDDSGGMEFYSVAVFGTPDSGKCEFELTGRHLTLRADGNSVPNMAFGGPIVYGHGEENPKQNLFYYQTKMANEVFDALDAPQRDVALIAKAPRESEVPLQGKNGKFPGLRVGEMSSDQQELVEKVVKVMLAPYREADVNEVMEFLKASGGLANLHMAFYQQEDLESDKVWDIWRVEGPSLVWHFRGAPHVHTYVNIGQA